MDWLTCFQKALYRRSWFVPVPASITLSSSGTLSVRIEDRSQVTSSDISCHCDR